MKVIILFFQMAYVIDDSLLRGQQTLYLHFRGLVPLVGTNDLDSGACVVFLLQEFAYVAMALVAKEAWILNLLPRLDKPDIMETVIETNSLIAESFKGSIVQP